MCSKENRKFKSKHFQHHYKNIESKTLTRHVLCECKCRFDRKNIIQINDGIMINVYVSVKNFMYMKMIMFEILLHLL